MWLASMTQKRWQNEEVNAEMDEVCPECWEQSGNSDNGMGMLVSQVAEIAVPFGGQSPSASQ